MIEFAQEYKIYDIDISKTRKYIIIASKRREP